MSTPTKNYKLTFKPNGTVIEVDPAKVPYSETGNPGSVLEIALGNGVDIEHVCGGNIACSTCHVYVVEGLETCTAISSDEEDQLQNASGRQENSRLSCQCVADGTKISSFKFRRENFKIVYDRRSGHFQLRYRRPVRE